MTGAEFQRVVSGSVARLPARFRRALGGVAVIVRDRPPRGATGLYGLFEGTPLGEKSVWDPPSAPDRIVLFRRNLERDFPGKRELAREIQTTLMHEIGHFLGLDEGKLEKLGYG